MPSDARVGAFDLQEEEPHDREGENAEECDRMDQRKTWAEEWQGRARYETNKRDEAASLDSDATNGTL